MTILTYKQEQQYLISAGFSPSEAVIGSAIGMAESSRNTDAINWVPCVGFMQVNAKAHPQWTVEQLRDPAINARVAYAVYKSQGWKAWTTYTSGAYKKYMGAATAAAGSGGTVAALPGNPIQVGKDIGTGVKTLDQLNTLAGQVDNPGLWKRVLYILVGIVMVGIGILSMSATPSNIKLVKAVAKAGAIAA